MDDRTPIAQLVELLDQIRRERDAAIKLGEQRCNELHEQINRLRWMRSEIKRAIQLLKTGRSSDALVILQTLSRSER